MNSAPVLQFLEALTGIEGLIPDPYFGGAGPHQILPGGFLKVHADFNWHPMLKLDRRLNLLVYLNRDWREEYGGHLELWDTKAERCVRARAAGIQSHRGLQHHRLVVPRPPECRSPARRG